MPSLDRTRAKHQEIVKQLARDQARRDKLWQALRRADDKVQADIRAVTRSQKRIDKLVAAATHNGGPTASASAPLIKAVAEKPTVPVLNDPVPDLGSKPVRAIPYTEAHPHSNMAKRQRAAKERRTPDDFKADMARKKKEPAKAAGSHIV
jgi:hypothetical protein